MGDNFYKVFRETLTEKVTFVHRPRRGIGKEWCRYPEEDHLRRENSKEQIPRGRIMSGMSKKVHRVHGSWKREGQNSRSWVGQGGQGAEWSSGRALEAVLGFCLFSSRWVLWFYLHFRKITLCIKKKLNGGKNICRVDKWEAPAIIKIRHDGILDP